MKSASPRWCPVTCYTALLVTFLLPAAALALPPDPLAPASSGGFAELDRALARLSAHRRLLVIAAHPDDEDTRLLTYVARGLGGEAAYLSLSRGEGGQNLIGPELGLGLGLLRSRELLAARSVDGARQFFTRAYDFGYTRSLDETLRRWPKDALLADAVRVVRRFKPQVVVAVFPPTSGAGHGQHWASGVVAPEAYELAADADAFPEFGLPAWRAQAFYRAAFFDRAAATLEYPLGDVEPWSGRSIFQISMESRSQHRCQDMGLVQPLGDATGALTWQAGGAGAEGAEVFAGVDTRLASIAATLDDEDTRRRVGEQLDQVAELARGARQKLSATAPHAAAASLGEIVRTLRAVRSGLGGNEGGEDHVRELLDEKLAIAQEALATAAGLLADATTDRETVVPGRSFDVRTVFWNAGNAAAGDLRILVAGTGGWRETGRRESEDDSRFFATRLDSSLDLTVEVHADAEPSIPYFLRRPLDGDLYDWSAAPADVRGEPFAPPPLVIRFETTVDGTPIALEREVVFRQRDQAYGEVRRPLRVVPRLEVAVEPDLVVYPLNEDEPVRLQVAVSSNVEEDVRARVELDLPDGWTSSAPAAVEIREPYGSQVVELTVEPADTLSEGRSRLAVRAVDEAGTVYRRSFPLVDYEHIRPTPQPRDAAVDWSAVDLRLPDVERIGYVRGAADRVPELLRAVGLPVDVLTGADLARLDLKSYDVVVVGSRAYETDAALGRFNGRLLDYARQGGTLVVQYQQYQFVRGGFAPFGLDIHRPHDRVTDEKAPVRVLAPDHAVFNTPNRIADRDWDGWVQERGLYFAGSWDEAFTPLLAMADPEGDEKQGALIVAPLGEGTYVYTGLAFFRQLPAGVPGAYRLFANLLALGEDR